MLAVTQSLSMDPPATLATPPVHTQRSGAALAQRQFDSRALFEGAQEVRIEHCGQEYRLRQTRNGKLILTK